METEDIWCSDRAGDRQIKLNVVILSGLHKQWLLCISQRSFICLVSGLVLSITSPGFASLCHSKTVLGVDTSEPCPSLPLEAAPSGGETASEA